MHNNSNPIKERLKEALAEETVRFEEFYLWLEKSMPKIFFNEVNKEWIFLIVHTLMGFQEQDYFSEIHLKNAAISLCLDSPEADAQILANYPLYGIKNYTTYVSREPLPYAGEPKALRIATLKFTEADLEKPKETLPDSYIHDLKVQLMSRSPDISEEQCTFLINKMDPVFLRSLHKDWQVTALEMFAQAENNDQCQYHAMYEENWREKNAPSMHVILAWKNVPKHNFLYRVARVIYRHGLMMRRVSAAYIDPYKTNTVFMLSFGLHGIGEKAAWETADINDFFQELVTVKYFGSQDLIDKTFVETRLIRGNLGNFVRTMMNFIHQVLVNADPNLYDLENIEEGLCRHPELTIKLCEAFEYKFHPIRHDWNLFKQMEAEFTTLVMMLDTGHEFHDQRRKNILNQGMNFISHILKTNFYLPNKTAFSFRLDPIYLEFAPFERKKLFPELPFGIFFIKGMHFFAFHIRFRDLARGGLRTIFPEKQERMLAERNVIFSECYNLAYTQHKKNKDIPEGGAKGVIFLKPYERLVSELEIYARELSNAGLSKEEIKQRVEEFKAAQKTEYLYETQRSFITNFLSLINCNADGSLREKKIVDYWKAPEYIYLGPDENMHDQMIEWIAKESKKEGYRPGGAFISGKPIIGINHKQYGVTSLGVNVFMEEVLRYMDIDPSVQPFTVKMTGGPDGDVAGNQIVNLRKYYPHTAKLIALTDISGTIYDPQGLDLKACENLFKEGRSIRFYPPEKLTKGGFLLDRETRREPSPYVQQTLCWRNVDGNAFADWISGNEMNVLYRTSVHKTKADIFIPCGGRPKTLRDTNYKDFFDKSGEPTARAIVEGANLYITPWARHYLEEQNVLIIKDSSANKAGVICSSFEILCGLTLTDEEFLANKDILVKEILQRLKECAYDEAKLLLETHKNTKIFLTELSDAISKKINLFTDQLLDYLGNIKLSDNPKDSLVQCFLHYCPKTLVEKFEGRLLREIPENHKKAIIASRIAARLVYRKGLDWYPTLVDIFPLLLHDKDLF